MRTTLEHARVMRDVCAGVYLTTKHKNAEWYYDHNAQTIYIMGTNDPDDVRDCLFGFYLDNHALSIVEAFEDMFLDDIYADERTAEMTVVGHSLGGSVAQVFASITVIPVSKVITFGAPRLFTKWFCPFEASTYRVYRRDDPIVSLKPWWLGYRHPDGKTLALGKPWWKRLLKRNPIHNHYMSSYVTALEADRSE